MTSYNFVRFPLEALLDVYALHRIRAKTVRRQTLHVLTWTVAMVFAPEVVRKISQAVMMRCMRLTGVNFVYSGQCTCDSGYTGASCDRLQCGDSLQCANGASCVDGSCVCAFGYSGNTCQVWDQCLGVTCNGHGRCVVFNGQPVCRCDDSSFGPESGDIANQCSVHTCSNGRVCRNGGSCSECV